mmetsp:Transcript_5977/g.14023  ORF Transcript_5977/g.14023 Transcript_5977/m.14023 type:complete len:133 (-) Transcript_5977:187-585(-)|eukprot:CAMPEP_0181474910 /NCGR_PEP_ID=MMETSP1110-20121109/40905_1 /TAXON_ID=174948 /ORGANISM="Symbiodinium sp., Strain CCMP421" /LENGTH=132 /DNA_ID=CAMNT_0023600117 /DNA_START=55 /DNA_END=453 /DNA_ORIENTATION=+
MTGNVREAREGVYEIVTMKTFVDVVQIVPPQKGLTRSYSWPRLAGAATEVLKVRGLSTLKQEVMQEKLAAKHRAGECLPCIFFTRKGDGCRQGDNCTRCHICTATEARRRRNRISLEMKKSKKAERRLAAFN